MSQSKEPVHRLAVWKADWPLPSQDAARFYAALPPEQGAPASPAIDAFLQELGARWPPPVDDEPDAGPWTAGFSNGATWAVLSVRPEKSRVMSRRVREMGTLRALGFGRWQVGGALLVESVLVGVTGGMLGLALAMLFDGAALNLLGLSFELDVRRMTLVWGGLLALAIGLLGGLLPARTAARLEIVEALRHL